MDTLKNLIEKFGVNPGSYSNFISKTTPGTFLRVSECLEKTKINKEKAIVVKERIILILSSYYNEKIFI